MPIFTIVAAHPVAVQYHELPRVDVRTFIVQGVSLQAAFDSLRGWAHVVDATEVMGVEMIDLCLTPDTLLRREEALEQWEHWSRYVISGDRAERPWTMLARGAETFRERLDRAFAKRHPELA